MDKKKIVIISLIAGSVFIVLIVLTALIFFVQRQNNNKRENEQTQNLINDKAGTIENSTNELDPDKDYIDDANDLTYDQKEDLEAIDKIIGDLGQDNSNPDSDYSNPTDLSF